MFEEFGVNAGYVEDLHALYQQSPQAVDESWRRFFADLPAPSTDSVESSASSGLPPVVIVPADARAPVISSLTNGYSRAPATTTAESVLAAGVMQGRVYQLYNAYRVHGHLFAHVDPLGTPPEAAPELDLANFGLNAGDLQTTFPTVGIAGLSERATLAEIIAHLSETYCRSIGVEFTQVEDPEMRGWLQEKMEATKNRLDLDAAEVSRVLTKLTDAETFEQFIHTNYGKSTKRFSLEGAESMIAMLDLLIEYSGAHGAQEIIIGMAHRGRLNVLANIMGKAVREIFAQFDDKHPERFLGGGDVKYHLGFSTDRVTSSGASVHLSLAFNPSHLEWVNPVVEGRVRAKQDRGKRQGVMPLLIHGDASFMGQGVVAETLNMACLKGYGTGGTVHLVVNNQIGFTTVPEDARSTRYCTDITRMLKAPVFHVNGEDPEAVIQVTRLAIELRQRFARDVVIDMFCYRRYGHNEGDEPRFTQPLMYALIDKKPTVRQVYVGRLVEAGRITMEEADGILHARRALLEKALEEARKGDYLQPPSAMAGVWAPYVGGLESKVPEAETSVPRDTLLALLEQLTTLPAGFEANPKVRKVIEQRRTRAIEQGTILWETGEQLAMASLLLQGVPIRLSGQDARRGTFSHRHAVLYDTQTGEPYTPLSHLSPLPPPPTGAAGTRPIGKFEVWDSPLSEAAVLGFEYGYSLDRPEGLVVWEAQFGDFVNSGQVIIDQFLASAEDKWLRLSGLVLLLPHGYEGSGPEHSSGRIERFLQMCAEDNIQVCNPTTPAQFFHLLRRQVVRQWRKPLVVMTPKSLLRRADAVSRFDELTAGRFHRVLPDDPSIDAARVTRILLCSGKVYYDLAMARKERHATDVAIVRVEQYYPLPASLREVLSVYPSSARLLWVQEEPRNMGAWYFMNANLPHHLGNRFALEVVSRPESASPATGSHSSHELEQRILMGEAFE
jgi:2-oxoglutarate dehydrogenase E1 component